MVKYLKNSLIIAVVLAAMILSVSAKKEEVYKIKFPKGTFFVEAENFIKEKQTGGQVGFDSRVEASNNKCILAWNYEGHTLEWKVDVYKKAKYYVGIRYCHNRSGNAYRKFMIDGKIPNKAFERITLVPTGGWSKSENDWNNIFVSDETGKPVEVELGFGKHILTIANLGGDGQDGASNFDYIGFFPVGSKTTDMGPANPKFKEPKKDEEVKK